MPSLAATDPSAVAILASIALLCAVGGLLPFTPMEAIVVGIAVSVRPALVVPVIIVATITQMAAKVVVFAGGRSARAALGSRRQALVDAARERLSGRRSLRVGTTFVSAVAGLPPFYAVTVAYGALRLPFAEYMITGTFGRTLRLAALIIMGRMLVPAVAPAQVPSEPPAVTVRGSGPQTMVLVSGIIGGVGGLRRLEGEMLRGGHRVGVIDPFRLSIASADMSFSAIAGRVERVLAERGITGAHVVAHSHGGGVMLRVAADAPERVASLTLIEVGAQQAMQSAKLDLALRVLPSIAKAPGGRQLLRRRLVAGLRQNASNQEFLDAATERAYAEPLLDRIDDVMTMGRRMMAASEPETIDAVLARIRVPVTVLLGAESHSGGPRAPEIAALGRLGSLLRVERVPGAAYFPHEEAPAAVARLVAPRLVAVSGSTHIGGRP